MKARGGLSRTLVSIALSGSLLVCGAAAARADINSPWVTVRASSTKSVATTASATPGAPKVVFIGTGAATLRSDDGGMSWTQVLAGATSDLASDPAVPGVVYAATSSGLKKSADWGQTWTTLSTAITSSVAVSPFDSQVLFGGRYRSADGGATWAPMSGLPGSIIIKTSRDPNRPGSLLAYAGGDAYTSTDDGLSWTKVTLSGAEDSIELDPVDARYWYVGFCGGDIYRMTPTGGSYSGVSGHVHGLVVDPAAHNRVYAAIDNGSVAVSQDFGATWNAPGGGRVPYGIEEGRMLFDGDSGIIYLPTYGGLAIKNSRCADADRDGVSSTGGVCGAQDCNDANAALSPFKTENCFDQVDNNCSGAADFADSWCSTNCVDGDGDGHFPLTCGGDDPANTDATVYPGAPELCDDKDNNLDRTVDEGCTRYTYFQDSDGDGFGSPTATYTSSFTTPPLGFLTDNQDCADWDDGINPGAAEICGDGLDNDCDGTADNSCPTYTYYLDNDNDSYGDPNQPVVSTVTDPTYIWASANDLDCDDTAGWISPAANEDCDWIDNNCDGVVDGGCGLAAVIWGDNSKGQLGDGTTTDRKAPTLLAGLEPISIAAGNQHTLVANNDGTVWAWGNNASGQLGDGTTTVRKTPVQVPGLAGVAAVSAGTSHSLALMRDGTVRAWGSNAAGQLGDGTATSRKSPVQVLNLTGVTAVSAGASHSLALLADGTVWAWGSNSKGQLGDGTTNARKTPVQVGLSMVQAIAAGGEFSLVLDYSGNPWTWGDNGKGQLGDGTTTTRKWPVQIPIWAWAIAAGSQHALAIGDGVQAWGDNSKGQLGDGTTTMRKTPVRVLDGAEKIAAGGTHSLAGGWNIDLFELRAWGNNADGQLGDGTTTNRKTPVVVPWPEGFTHFIAAGGAHSITLR